MTEHPAHVENARRALAHFDAATTGGDIGRRGVEVASAVRVLLYEPADGFQGEFMPGGKHAPDGGVPR